MSTPFQVWKGNDYRRVVRRSQKQKNNHTVTRMRLVVSRGHWQERDLFGNVVQPFRYPPTERPTFKHWAYRTNWFPSYTFKTRAFGFILHQTAPGKITVKHEKQP